jgi:hypothetical protein
MKLYLEVEQNDIALPVRVADSPVELARMSGATVGTVRSTVCWAAKGEYIHPRFISVDMDDSQEGEGITL